MKIPCPFRPDHHAVRLFDTYCRKCDRPFTPAQMLKTIRWKIRVRVEQLFYTECDECEFVSPLWLSKCPRETCNSPRSLRTAFKAFCRRIASTSQDLIANATTHEVVSFQRKLLGLSAAILFAFSTLVLKFSLHSNLGAFFGLVVVYLTASALLAKLFIPREKFWAYVDHTSRVVKLAVIFNYFSGLLLLGCLLSLAHAHAVLIAMLIGVTVVSAWLLIGIGWPLTASVLHLFLGERDSNFDPTKPQGRKVRNG